MARTKDMRPCTFDQPDSGQAMAEYALVVMLIAANMMFFLPYFMDALQSYYDSFYIMLNLPIP
jgi:Flp pilus assembly pilin Flp